MPAPAPPPALPTLGGGLMDQIKSGKMLRKAEIAVKKPEPRNMLLSALKGDAVGRHLLFGFCMLR